MSRNGSTPTQETHRDAARAPAPGERGQALVEMAIVLPVLLLLTMGIVKGGVAFNHWIMLTDAVRAGARVMAISRAPGIDACALGKAAVLKAAVTLVAPTPTVSTTYGSPSTSCTNLANDDTL